MVDVSDDRKVAYVLHIARFLCLINPERLGATRGTEHDVSGCLMPETLHSTLQPESGETASQVSVDGE
ncbi:hypothetical protein DC438_05780 [Cronobacter sakazakii]|nr:hypothetical protein DC438_05780 [Cronobacter sakazakii]PUY32027.1 hypothetical protein BS421_06115 [Cronobacter sakazakii]